MSWQRRRRRRVGFNSTGRGRSSSRTSVSFIGGWTLFTPQGDRPVAPSELTGGASGALLNRGDSPEEFVAVVALRLLRGGEHHRVVAGVDDEAPVEMVYLVLKVPAVRPR